MYNGQGILKSHDNAIRVSIIESPGDNLLDIRIHYNLKLQKYMVSVCICKAYEVMLGEA